MSKKADYLTRLAAIKTTLAKSTATADEIATARKLLRVITEEIREFSVNKAARKTTTSLDGPANLAVIKADLDNLITSINNEWANDPAAKSREESK
jgi:hypothetical protein